MKTKNVLHAIAALNMEPIKNKLMDAESGEGWSKAKAEAMEIEYRRFLHLMHVFPNEPASPTKAVDTFWHYHILDTQKYAADCDEVFGCFMHHNPYGDEASADSGVSGGARMQELYEATFGEAYIRPEVYCLDLAATDMAFSDGTGAAMSKGKAGAKSARCWGFCIAQTKGASAQPAGAKSAVCWGFCIAQTKSASAKSASASPASAKSAVCWGFCIAQTKSASKKNASAKAADCHGMYVKQAQSAKAQASASANVRMRQKTPVHAAAYAA